MTQERTTPDAVPGVGYYPPEEVGWGCAGIDLRLVQAVSLAGGPSALPGEKEIQEGDEKTSTDEQEARALDRLRTVITYFFSTSATVSSSRSSVRLT